jgi:hypothetical protein
LISRRWKKNGKFTALNLVSVLNLKRGMHVVAMYLLAGRAITQVRPGESMLLKGLLLPLTAARYYLPHGGQWDTRFVVTAFPAAARVTSKWG